MMAENLRQLDVVPPFRFPDQSGIGILQSPQFSRRHRSPEIAYKSRDKVFLQSRSGAGVRLLGPEECRKRVH